MQRCNRLGVPWVAVAVTCLPLPLVYLTVSNGASVVFGWFLNITTLAGLIGWIVIEVTYIRFFNGLAKQGYSRDGKCAVAFMALVLICVDLPYKSPLQPYISYFSLVMVILVVLFSGFDVFVTGNFTAAGFITCYLNIAIFAGKFYLNLDVLKPWLRLRQYCISSSSSSSSRRLSGHPTLTS